MQILIGELEAYWEQGYEGRIDYAFCFPGNDHPFFIENGDQLTIYNPDGTTLWDGTIQFVKRSTWWDHHKLDAEIWSYIKQKGVSYADWMDWFWRKPALKARLRCINDRITLL
jgi:hypothetical protein